MYSVLKCGSYPKRRNSRDISHHPARSDAQPPERGAYYRDGDGRSLGSSNPLGLLGEMFKGLKRNADKAKRAPIPLEIDARYFGAGSLNGYLSSAGCVA